MIAAGISYGQIVDVLVPVSIVTSATGLLLIWLIRRSCVWLEKPCCATCGYCVWGLSTTVCPECGSDLCKAGVFRAGTKLPMRPRWVILIWTLMLPAPTGLVSLEFMRNIGPWTKYIGGDITITPVQAGQPVILGHIEGEALSHGFGGNPTPPSRLTLQVRQPGFPLLIADLESCGWRIVDAGGQVLVVGTSFGEESVIRWLRMICPSQNGALLHEWASEIYYQSQECRKLANLRFAGGFSSAGSSFTANRASFRIGATHTCGTVPAWWGVCGVIAAWAVVWWGGGRMILRRRRAVVFPQSVRICHAILGSERVET